MSFSNWSFKFHNKVLKHSNWTRKESFHRTFKTWPVPGNVCHLANQDTRIDKVKRTEKQWARLLENKLKHEGRKHDSLSKLWWRLHPNEIYWK